MNQDEIAKGFRTTELQRRAGRRQRILNEALLELDDDPITLAALERIRAAEDNYQSLIRPKRGYWPRLWAALWGRE